MNPDKDLFFVGNSFNSDQAQEIIDDALSDCDDGELFLEYVQSESLAFDDGRLKAASFDTERGFGLRAVAGEATGYAHATEITRETLKRAAETVTAVRKGYGGKLDLDPPGTNKKFYADDNPLDAVPFADKVKLLETIDSYARKADSRVQQVSASLSSEWQAVQIMRPDGHTVRDLRPLVRLNVQIVAGQGERQEAGFSGGGGRHEVALLLDPEYWQWHVEEAIRQALVNLESVPAPAGEMPVVLGPGWPGILLHEAVGHGLEGDYNRKKTSAFAGLMGEQVAARGITVVDDGTLENRRGSLTVDDEGTPSEYTVLIEDGILKNYMQDRQNARLMGMKPTGNARRESFAHQPLPRMTNTYMLAGGDDPDSIIASVDKGLYAVTFGGGQVDTTSGKFVFSCTEAYLIEGGKIGAPVKGATLIGNGPDILTKVSAIGNDMKLDTGIGVCGKEGQGVPVGVGQPTLKIDSGITVGGTAV